MAYNYNRPAGGASETGAQPAGKRTGTPAGPRALRLFTALWPDESTRRALARLRDAQHWPDEARPVDDANLHLTLVFLGQVAQSQLPALTDRLAAVQSQPFELCLDRIETWGDGLVVLCPPRSPAGLMHLHDRLREISRDLGLPLESRAYRPHVTLARSAARGRRRAGGTALVQPDSPLRWCVRDFVLAQSRPSEPYRLLHRFGGARPLG